MARKKAVPHRSLQNGGKFELNLPLNLKQLRALKRGLGTKSAVRMHIKKTEPREAFPPGEWDQRYKMTKLFVPYLEGLSLVKKLVKGKGQRVTIIPDLQSHFTSEMIAALTGRKASAIPNGGSALLDRSGKPMAVPPAGVSALGRGPDDDDDDDDSDEEGSDESEDDDGSMGEEEVGDFIEELTKMTAASKKAGQGMHHVGRGQDGRGMHHSGDTATRGQAQVQAPGKIEKAKGAGSKARRNVYSGRKLPVGVRELKSINVPHLPQLLSIYGLCDYEYAPY